MSISVCMSKKKEYSSVAGYGVDVSCQRADDLDRLALHYVRTCARPIVLDVGCGLGGQSLRLVHAGALVTAVDVHDFSQVFAGYRADNQWSREQLSFQPLALQELAAVFGERSYDVVMMQRVLHYVPYLEAQRCLASLRTATAGRLYLSVSGVHTALGAHYTAKGLPLVERFALLSSKGAALFSITKPVCLYTQSELETLLRATGWVIEQSWVSAFGNLKVVCR